MESLEILVNPNLQGPGIKQLIELVYQIDYQLPVVDGLKMESTDQAESNSSHIMMQELCSRFCGGIDEV